jgi:hypothetical protein
MNIENENCHLLTNTDNNTIKLKFHENNKTNIIEPLKGDVYGEANCLSKLFFFWSLKILMVYLF